LCPTFCAPYAVGMDRMPADSDPSSTNAPTASRTSSILLDFARRFPGERVRLQDLSQLLGNRSFGFLLFIFALPNTLPMIGIPGVSTLTGLPLVLIALQMMVGLPRPWLPKWLLSRSLHINDFRRLIEKTAPWLQKIEYLMRPRWLALTTLQGERFLGAFCLILGIVLSLPLPFGNLLPAIAVALIALGLIEKDGVVISAGMVFGVISLFVLWGVLWAVVQTAIHFVQHLIAR
jgi:hypothetical protein